MTQTPTLKSVVSEAPKEKESVIMTKKHEKELGAYAEMALMGCLVPVSNEEDLLEMLTK